MGEKPWHQLYTINLGNVIYFLGLQILLSNFWQIPPPPKKNGESTFLIAQPSPYIGSLNVNLLKYKIFRMKTSSLK